MSFRKRRWRRRVSERDEEVPDLDVIKQGGTGSAGQAQAVCQGPIRQSCRAAARRLRAWRHGLPRCCSMTSHRIDAQGRLAGACRRSGGIAALSRPYRCATPFYAPSMRAISKNRFAGIGKNQAASHENAAALPHNRAARCDSSPSETSTGAFYPDCRVGRKAATSPGLRNILSTSLA
jgi:hypothetical protein